LGSNKNIPNEAQTFVVYTFEEIFKKYGLKESKYLRTNKKIG
jgi:hypothetical protein